MPNMMLDDLQVKERILGPTDWNAIYSSAPLVNRVQFRLARDFNKASKLLALKFLTELTDEFGELIEPIMLKDGCVSIDVLFHSAVDYRGRDFRGLILQNPKYHEIFRRFDVSHILLQGFEWGSSDNARHAHFGVDSTGKARPI